MTRPTNYLSMIDVPDKSSTPHWIFYIGAFAALTSAIFSFLLWRKR